MSRPKPRRLDRLVVERGWAVDLEQAQSLIEHGLIEVDGVPVWSPTSQIRPDRPVECRSTEHVWVGRGAYKLLGALDDLAMDVRGAVCADLGSSTGGFTEVLLRAGAARVYAIDVGKGLLHRRLLTDSRVVAMEGVNVRHLERLPEKVTRIVGDLSFVSLTKILPAVVQLLGPGGEALLLIKPQFEARRDEVERGGFVDEAARGRAIERVFAALSVEGLQVLGHARSRLPGAKAGNEEHFVWVARLDRAQS